MKVAVYTSNQPRHVALVELLAYHFDQIVAVIESTTVFPGEVDDFYRTSPFMRQYFQRVLAAEQAVFGHQRFLPSCVQCLPVKLGDLSKLSLDSLQLSLDCDIHVVFGASYIKGSLLDELVRLGALNIHMGVSPYYRGSGCNFWALHDGNADLVGATIHRLSSGLDSGDILLHAIPPISITDSFELGMRAVEAAHQTLVRLLVGDKGPISQVKPIPQNKKHLIRYSRYADFTEEVVEKYLANIPSESQIRVQRSHKLRSELRLSCD
jgi:hypothetical protein